MSIVWWKFAAAGMMTLVSKMIPVHLEPDILEVKIYNDNVELYDPINYHTATHQN
jgi:hypothetical protein